MPAIVAVLLFAVWIAVMWFGFVIAFPVLFPSTLLVVTAAALITYYVQACRTLLPAPAAGPSEVPRPEIAYRHYLISQVWRDWWAVARDVGPLVLRTAQQALAVLTGWLLGGVWGFFAFPFWAALCGGIVLATLPVVVLGLLLTVLYGLVAAIGLVGWLLCVAVLAAVERVFMAYGRILQTCPHPFCYEKIALPVYACPSCDIRHSRLAPNTAGAFRHVCRCGARLPTTVPLGRYRLTAYCPHCGGRLPDRIGRVRVEPLPFIGGPAAGKTTFMFLAVRALHARARAGGGRVAFVEKRHAQAYAAVLERFQDGGRPDKTGPELPLATMVDVELPGAGRRILYLFDPAGEHFAGARQVESLRYLDHGEALLFIVDPFALPEVQRCLTGAERELIDRAAASSGDDPTETLQRVLNDLRSRPDRGRQKRIAVVVTKADLLVRTEIGSGLQADAGGDAEENTVREWLLRLGLGNAIRTLEQTAGQVRYFGSGLDTEPAEVAELLGWVTGLAAGGRPADGGLEVSGEVPGTAPLRDPWPVRGRDAELVPAGYQAGRWSILAGLSALSVTAIALTTDYAIRHFT